VKKQVKQLPAKAEIFFIRRTDFTAFGRVFSVSAFENPHMRVQLIHKKHTDKQEERRHSSAFN